MTRNRLVYGSFWRQALDLLIFIFWVLVAIIIVTIPLVVSLVAAALIVGWIWDVLS